MRMLCDLHEEAVLRMNSELSYVTLIQLHSSSSDFMWERQELKILKFKRHICREYVCNEFKKDDCSQLLYRTCVMKKSEYISGIDRKSKIFINTHKI